MAVATMMRSAGSPWKSGSWRLCFRWSEGNAFEVEITDYH
jgi:plasmid maintenance system killer protein